MIMNK